jgi:uncharacterized protein (DUF302 family)
MPENGIVRIASAHSFDETFDRLESAVKSRGLLVFATIDFDGDAERAGLKMKPTRLLIFGNPKAGTPLMEAAPSVALDFPLKILVSEDSSGMAWVSYNSPEYLRIRHDIPEDLLKNISGIEPIASSAAR